MNVIRKEAVYPMTKPIRDLIFILKEYSSIARKGGWNKQTHAILILKLKARMKAIEKEFRDGS